MALDIIAWHDRDTAGHKQQFDSSTAKGYRTLSLCIYGERNNPRYAAVMIKRPVAQVEQHFFGLTASQYQAKFNEMAAKGLGPYLVSATGPTADPLFAVSFMPIKPTPLTRHGLSAADLDKLNDEQMVAGGILRSADAYGTPGDVRYVAVWYPNPEQVSWNCDTLNDNYSTTQQRYDAITSAGGRPYLQALTPGGGVLQAFADTSVGAFAARGNLTSQQYQDEFNKNMAAGRAPVCISAEGQGADTRFAAIFCGREDVLPRTFRATGPSTVPGIDQAMEKFMRAQNLRNVSLAITFGTRLVYAKGYTWAEADYPTVQPTTVFRQASVSKTLAALAMYQIFEQNPQVTLDTTVQSVLNLKTPAGGPPPDPRFAKVTIRHLLESTSAIERGGIWQDVATAQAFGGLQNLPVGPAQLTRYIASLKLEGQDTPGDTHNVKYNNTAYYLLSQVVAKLRGVASFEEALVPLLKPLGITRIRQSVSLVSAQPPDEARYQLRYLNVKSDKGVQQNYQRAFGTAPSVRTPSQPLVPQQYGAWSSENHDGAGGLSAAATDLARLVAMFSAGAANPVLKAATLNQLLASAATCSATYSSKDPNSNDFHGFHGFDWAKVVDKSQNIYIGAKGGWLSSSQNSFDFTTGGYGYVVCMGSNNYQGVNQWWEAEVQAAAEKYPWGASTDLFPQFGMAALVPAAKPASPAPSLPAVPRPSIAETIRLNQAAAPPVVAPAVAAPPLVPA